MASASLRGECGGALACDFEAVGLVGLSGLPTSDSV